MNIQGSAKDISVPRDKAAETAQLVGAFAWLGQAALIATVVARAVSGALDAGLVGMAAGAVLGLGLARAGLERWSSARLTALAERHVKALRETIISTELSRRGTESPAVLAGLVSEKLEMLRPAILRFGPARRRAMVVPLVLLVVAFSISWAAGAILLVAGPLIPVFSALVGMAAQQASARQLDQMSTLGALLSERVGALIDIRLLGAETTVLNDFANATDDLRRRTMAVLKIAFLTSTALELFAALGVAMMAVFVGFSLLGQIGFGTWGGPLTVWSGVFLLLIAPEFFAPLRDMSAAWHDRAAAMAVADEVIAWRDRDAARMVGVTAAELLKGEAQIHVQGLTLRVGDQLIRYPDFRAKAGQALAISGPSGSGKTTLLAALAGLMPAYAGRITVAGQALDDTTAGGWRARIGWMPQSPHFMNASVLANLKLARPDATTDQVQAALRAAGIQAQVMRLPHGINETLGETGAGLSGGEARRLTLARALLAGADVLLVDEPTADLDEGTAAAVRKTLLDLRAQGVLLVLATHDPELVAACDQVISPAILEEAA
ncbi:thiol reductant ABC exporter subunit CydD [Donghicola sp. C2-DW-16]|uniref:Thiol reductant ABC exporter subunit CydD n=1 Tax=Donghicola mangrovi TaxID=2729614 RepID=A0ABX2PDV4_9RHOB|nr:thiol reductant ABC exporter subunit CydD [Donghicola mangrovi]NVO27660.1 thiol reductant ABC exporter subunit CydD [Donghicola mangrovi]